MKDAANIEANGGVVDALGVQGHFRDADGVKRIFCFMDEMIF